jgi:hypothetical protein
MTDFVVTIFIAAFIDKNFKASTTSIFLKSREIFPARTVTGGATMGCRSVA